MVQDFVHPLKKKKKQEDILLEINLQVAGEFCGKCPAEIPVAGFYEVLRQNPCTALAPYKSGKGTQEKAEDPMATQGSFSTIWILVTGYYLWLGLLASLADFILHLELRSLKSILQRLGWTSYDCWDKAPLPTGAPMDRGFCSSMGIVSVTPSPKNKATSTTAPGKL